ncbi:DUF3103 family protein [Luteibacter sp. RCC_6_2]|uniref:DUF3103 family protein n=1 Tax=Luteibacter sp. RCC_6_2 TaxID=3239223 RepID=UPI003525D983
MKRILKFTLIGTALAFALSSPLMAAEVTSVNQAREETAKAIAVLVNDPTFDATLREQLSKGKAPLADVLRNYAGQGTQARENVTTGLRDLERQAIRLRGLDGTLDALFDIRVHGVDKDQPITSIRGFWTATVSKDQATGQKQVVAYDPSGREQRFSLDAAPDVPMLIVESDSSAAIQAGMTVMNEILRNGGMQAPMASGNLRAANSVEELTILQEVRLERDHEPNIQGDAEIFAIVSGVAPDGTPRLITKDMPWLDHDKRWYKPGMDLINWTDYGTNYVNVQFFEEDGNTNFKALAVAVTKAVGNLALVVSPGAPPALIVAGVSKVGAEILGAMDEKWFQNDADYVDSFYVVERGGKYGSDVAPLVGARGEAKMVLAPYVVKSR